MPYAQTWVNDSVLTPSQTDSDGPDLRDRSRPEVLEPDHGICAFRGASSLSHQIHDYEQVAITADLNRFIGRNGIAMMNFFE